MMLNILIIGLGSISEKHRRNIKSKYPQSIINCIPSRNHPQNVRPKNCDKILSIEDAKKNKYSHLLICSPSSHHLNHLIALADVSENIFIEKPVSHNLIDAKKVLELSFKKKIYVGYCLRFMKSAQFLKSYIENDFFGTFYDISINVGQYLPNWRDKNYKESVSAKKSLGGGALLELSHEIDILNWLFGCKKIDSANIFFSNELDINTEDQVFFSGLTRNNSQFSIRLDFLSRAANRCCVLNTSEGIIHWDLLKDEISISTDKVKKYLFQNKKLNYNDMYTEIMKAFLKPDESNFMDLPTAKEGYEVIEIIDEIKKIANVIERNK